MQIGIGVTLEFLDIEPVRTRIHPPVDTSHIVARQIGTMLGEIGEKNAGLKDLNWREIAYFAPLVVWASGRDRSRESGR